MKRGQIFVRPGINTRRPFPGKSGNFNGKKGVIVKKFRGHYAISIKQGCKKISYRDKKIFKITLSEKNFDLSNKKISIFHKFFIKFAAFCAYFSQIFNQNVTFLPKNVIFLSFL